ncbi:hypothetical protein OB446_027105 [Paenibacillus alvei]|uniref:hypothetical protein n=1 Tax=Paenibacillus alvei TaxID=44250 RepID=UPI0002886D69|nr:hypothetical protein [Paenibacillus alvei]EJW13947.1 hypothetical protein PAV_141p00530 [Paenibacillus alvei DSM 29]MCY9707691.1 hypothetical protein [Paenibacillus alvei]MEC0082796.1 hypothetical protein [Paenibacillus alvei]
MKFTSELKKKHEFVLEVGDFFQYDESTFVIVQPLIKDNYDYKNEGYTYVNLTYHSLVYPKFETLEELKDYLTEKKEVKFYRGGNVVVNLGSPFYEILQEG